MSVQSQWDVLRALARRGPDWATQRGWSRDLVSLAVQLVPSETGVRQSWEGVKLAFRQAQNASPHNLDQPLSPDEAARTRYVPKPGRYAAILGPKLGAGLDLGLSVLGPNERAAVIEVLDELPLDKMHNLEATLKALKTVSDHMKRWGEAASKYWKLFVGVELLGGWKPMIPIEEFVDDIKQWIDVVPDVNLPYQLMVDGFRDALGLPVLINGLTVEEYAAAYNWARPGASDGPRPELDVEGKIKRPRKSKNASALALSPGDVRRMILEYSPHRADAIEKQEKGKVRAVVNVGLVAYLQMDFLDQMLIETQHGREWTTLFYNARMMVDLFNEMGLDADNQSLTKLPLDQAEFDHMVPQSLVVLAIETTVEYLLTCIRRREVREQVRIVADNIINGIANTIVHVGGRVVHYRNGILSGWKWTAFLDSLVNHGQLFSARQLVRRYVGVDPVVRAVVQGDDVRCVCSSPACALGVVQTYYDFGLKINPSKFFMSHTRDEYLRQVAEAQVVSGYFWRVLPSIMFRGPLTTEARKGEVRCRELMSNWMTLVGRGANFDLVLPLMTDDLSGATSTSEEVITSWLQLSSALGGGGLQLRTMGSAFEPGPSKLRGVSIANSSVNKGWAYFREVAPTVTGAVAEGILLDKLNLSGIASYDRTNFRLKMVDFAAPEVIPSSQPVRLSPRPSDVYPVYLLDAVREQAIRSSDWATLKNTIDPRDLLIAEELFRRASRAFFVEWVKGLTASIPVIPGYSPLYLSVLASDKTEWLRGAVMRSKPDLEHLKSARLRLEEAVRHDVLTTFPVVRIAG